MAFVLFDNISFSFTQKFWETSSVTSTNCGGKQWSVLCSQRHTLCAKCTGGCCTCHSVVQNISDRTVHQDLNWHSSNIKTVHSLQA